MVPAFECGASLVVAPCVTPIRYSMLSHTVPDGSIMLQKFQDTVAAFQRLDLLFGGLWMANQDVRAVGAPFALSDLSRR